MSKRVLRTLSLLTLLASLGFSRASHAQGPLDEDIDLFRTEGFASNSMTDPTWARYPVGAHQDVPIGRCGCLIATLSSLSRFYYGVSSKPHFRWADRLSGMQELSFSPRYLDVYLRWGSLSGTNPPAENWGYKAVAPKSCGTAPKPWALELSAIPTVVYVPGTTTPATSTPTGLRWGVFHNVNMGLDKIDENLRAKRPSIVVIEVPNGSGGTTRHAQLVVGWDNTLARYKILDPVWPNYVTPQVAGGTTDDSYSDWLTSIVEVFDVTEVHRALSPEIAAIALYDDPGPLEFLVIGPDGRRTGFDPALGRNIAELESVQATKQGSWTPPTGPIEPMEPARFIEVPQPERGNWRFVVVGTGDGVGPLTFSTILGGVETVVLDTVTPLSTGSTTKFEMSYAPSGSSVVQVDDFHPEARAHAPARTRTEVSVTLDGSNSFDPDGTVASYLWDFGDGTTASSATVSHAWATANVYPVRLTVTDAEGNSGSTTINVSVAGSTPVNSGLVTQRVSTDGSGAETFGISTGPSVTPDHAFVAFVSTSASLVPNDLNGVSDVFVKNVATAEVQRVSVSSSGEEAAADLQSLGSTQPSISADGRFVAFVSNATNPVANDNNNYADVFVHDRQTGVTELVSVATDGAASEGACLFPSISADGRYVAFESFAANLAPGSNGLGQIYLRDRQTSTTELISASTGGSGGFGRSIRPSISANGRFVAFESAATNLVVQSVGSWSHAYVRDRQSGTTEVVSLTHSGTVIPHHGFGASMSADGRYVAFSSSYFATVANDNNSLPDVFVRDRQLGTTRRVSLSTLGAEGDAASFDPSISPDGRWVSFYSTASNLVPDDTNRTGPLPSGVDIFLHDLQTGTTERASLASDGTEALPDVGLSSRCTSVGLGGSIAFCSRATNLVPDDTNGQWDVFLRARPVPRPIAEASGPYLGWADGVVPAYVEFDARRSFDPTGAALTARWDFGDGSPTETLAADTTARHAYASQGTYTVTLVVTNGQADSEPVSTTAQILPPQLPTAERTEAVPACAVPGARVDLYLRGTPMATAAGGFDLGSGRPHPGRVDDVPASLPVTFSSNAETRVLNAAVERVSVQSGIERQVSVSLVLPSDLAPAEYAVSVGSASALSFSVPCPPEVAFRPRAVAGGPYSGEAGVEIEFDGSGSVAVSGAPLEYRWDFGDGETGSGERPRHVYAEPGTYLLTLVVMDGPNTSLPKVRGDSFADVVVAPSEPSSGDAGVADARGPGSDTGPTVPGVEESSCDCRSTEEGSSVLFTLGLAVVWLRLRRRRFEPR